MKSQAMLLCAILAITLTTLAVLSEAEFAPSDPSQSDSSLEQIVKRPFCNTFSGCFNGRKRADSETAELSDPSDALLQRLGQQILREARLRGGLQTKIDLLALRNRLKQNQFRGSPWLDLLSEQRKKRMASASASADISEDLSEHNQSS